MHAAQHTVSATGPGLTQLNLDSQPRLVLPADMSQHVAGSGRYCPPTEKVWVGSRTGWGEHCMAGAFMHVHVVHTTWSCLHALLRASRRRHTRQGGLREMAVNWHVCVHTCMHACRSLLNTHVVLSAPGPGQTLPS